MSADTALAPMQKTARIASCNEGLPQAFSAVIHSQEIGISRRQL
jgi:hypothetical protein